MAGAASTPGDPFALHIAPNSLLARAALAAARPAISIALGLPALRQVYARAQSASLDTFEARALEALNVRFRVHSTGTEGIPRSGPLIVAANHPTGAMDGLVVAEVVRQVRPDVRLVANHLLARIPELGDSCFFVDPFGGPAARARSRSGLRSAHLWLRGGGALILFPAGEVAWHKERVDSPWFPTVGRLALAAGASVLPVFVDGQNSRLFYIAGRVHPVVRTLLLGRELLKQRGTTTTIYLGAPLSAERVRRAKSAAALTATIRRAVELAAPADSRRNNRVPTDVDPAVDPGLLARDVEALPAGARLLSSGVYDVFCADASSIPHVLREIGRLREITFRSVGEGTGRSTDLDRFDRHYRHLFVWNRRQLQVVGAYRVGATDRIMAEHGLGGLYTTTLFHYDERMLECLAPALELGRSFVRAEYQRSYNALLLLWKGIGRLVARAPQYRVLFGPVSISSRYQETSQAMLRAFLSLQHGDAELTALVQPRNLPSPLAPHGREIVPAATVDELDASIARQEGGAGIPVLLRQYLRLNARVLGFNVDPAFGGALDALMMVDLTRLPVATLQRYLGAAEALAFLETHHATRTPATAA